MTRNCGELIGGETSFLDLSLDPRGKKTLEAGAYLIRKVLREVKRELNEKRKRKRTFFGS